MDSHQKSMMASYHQPPFDHFLPFPSTLGTFSVFLQSCQCPTSLVSSHSLLLPLLSLVFYKFSLITLALIAFPLIVALQVWSHHSCSCCFCSRYCFTSSLSSRWLLLFFFLLLLYKLNFIALICVNIVACSSSQFCKHGLLGCGLLRHWDVASPWSFASTISLGTLFPLFSLFLIIFTMSFPFSFSFLVVCCCHLFQHWEV
jgi:hypothetical protein